MFNRITNAGAVVAIATMVVLGLAGTPGLAQAEQMIEYVVRTVDEAGGHHVTNLDGFEGLDRIELEIDADLGLIVHYYPVDFGTISYYDSDMNGVVDGNIRSDFTLTELFGETGSGPIYQSTILYLFGRMKIEEEFEHLESEESGQKA